MGRRVLRAAAAAGLLSLVLATRVYVDVDLVRVTLVAAPVRATNASVSGNTARRPRAHELQTPFAVTARIRSAFAGTESFSIAVDGMPICTRDLAGGSSRRVDCAVVSNWDPALDHDVVVRGPPSDWTLDSLELSTHHGRNKAPMAFIVLPAGSGQYRRPAPAWVIVTFLLLTALMTFAVWPSMPRWLRIPYLILSGAIVLELAISLTSRWLSSYRIVLSAGTFAGLVIVLVGPHLWSAGRAVIDAAMGSTPAGSPARRRRAQLIVLVVVAAVAVSASVAAWERSRAYNARQRLLTELQPIALRNCEFKRFGESNDGGYVLCANLLDSVQSSYSYGISGYDGWGCDVSRRLSIPVHEYDCFDLRDPSCPAGRAVFHPECVGTKTATIDGRPFDFPEHQFERNGDTGKRLVVKMDVEGAEWDTLAQASDSTLDRIDQLAIELHGVEDPDRLAAVIKRLKQFFYIASLHFNNFACQDDVAPFPAWAYEALFVNKRIAVVGGPAPAGAPRSELAPNNPQWSDCQSVADLPQIKK
jgi:hypothetical protein